MQRSWIFRSAQFTRAHAVEISSGFFSIHVLGFCVITVWEMEQALNGIKYIATTQNALEIQSTHNSRVSTVAD